MSQDRRYLLFEKRADDNAWLDLLRAAAIVLVLLRHGTMASAPLDAGGGFLRFVAVNGWVGVDLFFVLSGYLISRHLVRNGFGTPGFSYRRYISMRALRIVPAYFVVIALILVSAFPLYRIGGDDLGWRTLYHLLFLQDYLPADINVAFWSLGVEEKFYLLAPLLLWLAMRRGSSSKGILILAGLFVLPSIIRATVYLAGEIPLDYPTFFQKLRSPFHASLEPLVIGVAIAIADQARVIRLSPYQAALIFSAAGGAFIAYLGSHDMMGTITLYDAVPQPTLLAVLCGLLVLGAVRMTPVSIPFEPAVRVVARLSYGLYLVHYPLLPLSLALSRESGNPAVMFWLDFIALSFAAAGLLYYAVEMPFLRLKDQLSRKRPVGEPAVVPAPSRGAFPDISPVQGPS